MKNLVLSPIAVCLTIGRGMGDRGMTAWRTDVVDHTAHLLEIVAGSPQVA